MLFIKQNSPIIQNAIAVKNTVNIKATNSIAVYLFNIKMHTAGI